jgi:hypothetical protein
LSTKTDAWNTTVNKIESMNLDWTRSGDRIYIQNINYEKASQLISHIQKYSQYLRVQYDNFDMTISYR